MLPAIIGLFTSRTATYVLLGLLIVTSGLYGVKTVQYNRALRKLDAASLTITQYNEAVALAQVKNAKIEIALKEADRKNEKLEIERKERSKKLKEFAHTEDCQKNMDELKRFFIGGEWK